MISGQIEVNFVMHIHAEQMKLHHNYGWNQKVYDALQNLINFM
jgi:hypothetical protein